MDVGVDLLQADPHLNGTALKPVSLGNLHCKMDLKGERLSVFDRLLDVSPPPVGPCGFRGKFGNQPSVKSGKDWLGSGKLTATLGEGRFDIMRPEALLIDSNRIQASGDGAVDFKYETVEFEAKP